MGLSGSGAPLASGCLSWSWTGLASSGWRGEAPIGAEAVLHCRGGAGWEEVALTV